MKLFLVRHGETVDNVAGLYAGVRDSALTNHGFDQARRLGEYFAQMEVRFSQIFSSPLSRAYKTAEAIQTAQKPPSDPNGDEKRSVPGIAKVKALMEQDFGFYEGKTYYSKTDPRRSGRDAHHEKHKKDSGFVDIESKDAIARRADVFLDEHLVPLLHCNEEDEELVVAVVSHGMLLMHLWRRLLLRLPRKSLTIAPEVTEARGSVVLEHLGGWGNTGYLELVLTKGAQDVGSADTGPLHHGQEPPRASPGPNSSQSALSTESTIDGAIASPTPVPQTAEVGEAEAKAEVTPQTPAELGLGKDASGPQILHGWSTTILAVDSKHHLGGLKRQRGGIGSLAHDEGQKKLDSFFRKRQKTD
ncbi:phosphoglycerate mutase-like protein [Hortaea werneckii]|nr:phosphoglycerate mutase-like protein [Hortaea werneckii]